jgi:hypothetical protein
MEPITDPNEVLMTAILSMDVYSRDPNYGSAPILSKLSNTALGSATFEADLYNQSTNFGAVAWDWGGQTIIAYEGTVSNTPGTIVTSALNGWGVVLGIPGGPQATEAIAFYQHVANATANFDGNYQNADIVLTGHSAGGGLAGYVGAIYGQEGVLFDSPIYS